MLPACPDRGGPTLLPVYLERPPILTGEGQKAKQAVRIASLPSQPWLGRGGAYLAEGVTCVSWLGVLSGPARIA